MQVYSSEFTCRNQIRVYYLGGDEYGASQEKQRQPGWQGRPASYRARRSAARVAEMDAQESDVGQICKMNRMVWRYTCV